MNVKISTLISWGLLLVVTQLLVTQWTIHASENAEVVNYVSFAGTVVGIILAVLAIVYSYVSSVAQHGDADNLRLEVSRLNSAIERANLSGDKFSGQLADLEEIKQRMQEVVLYSASSRDAAMRSEEMFKDYLSNTQAALAVKAEQSAIPASENDDALDLGSIARYLVSRALAYQLVLFYLATLYSKWPNENKNYPEIEESICKIMLIGDASTGRMEIVRGAIGAYWLIFTDLDVFGSVENTNTFKKAIIEEIPGATPAAGHPFYSPEGVKNALAIVASRIREEIA